MRQNKNVAIADIQRLTFDALNEISRHHPTWSNSYVRAYAFGIIDAAFENPLTRQLPTAHMRHGYKLGAHESEGNPYTKRFVALIS